MIQAFLDTSTSVATFVLARDGVVLTTLSKECLRGASKLLPEICALVRSCGVDVSDVDEWYVGKGPGSFTGLRVGISFVKGICHASGAKYVGVNSGYAYFSELIARDSLIEEITVLHDGRKKELICNSFRRVSKDEWQEEGTQVIAVDDLAKGNFVNCVSVMNADDLKVELDVLHIEQVNPFNFLKSFKEVSSDLSEMDKSCEPIYVRPPVFVQPAIRLKK